MSDHPASDLALRLIWAKETAKALVESLGDYSPQCEAARALATELEALAALAVGRTERVVIRDVPMTKEQVIAETRQAIAETRQHIATLRSHPDQRTHTDEKGESCPGCEVCR